MRRAATLLVPRADRLLHRAPPRVFSPSPQCSTLCTSRHTATKSLSVLLDIPPLKRTKSAHPSDAAKYSGDIEPPTKRDAEVDLFDAIVHDGVPVYKIRSNVAEVCVTADGSAAPLRIDEELLDRLRKCEQEKDAHGAFALLQHITEEGMSPTAAAFLRVIEICTRAREPELAEDALRSFSPVTRTYERKEDIDRSARTSIALALLSIGEPRDALRILRFGEVGTIRERIGTMPLSNDEVAWGCVIRALTAVGDPQSAVEAARAALEAGVPPSDSLTFFVLEALRACGRWRDADDTFEAALAAGVQPHERTVGSLLRTLTAPAVRRFVDAERIVTLARIPKDPSSRFRTVALVALASVGEVALAREMHEALVRAAAPNPPDERASSILIGAYASLVEPGAPHDVVDVAAWHARICDEIDELWTQFSTQFTDVRTSGGGSAMAARKREARSRAFQRYLWTKARCLRVADAASALENAVADNNMRNALDICTAHFAAVLTGVELTCNAQVLERVLRLMHRERIAHDPRTLAFAIGALLGHGDTHGAVALVRAHGPAIRDGVALAKQRDYRVALLRRRLDLLADSVQDAMNDPAVNAEIASLSEALHAHLRSSSRPRGSWR